MPEDASTPALGQPIEDGLATPHGDTERAPAMPRRAATGGVPPMFARHEPPGASTAGAPGHP
jgi:hypothetical protein